MKPPPLTEADKENFGTLLRAFANDDLVVMSAVLAKTGEPRAVLCAMETRGGVYQFKPLGVLIWDDPFELFEDPTANEEEEK